MDTIAYHNHSQGTQFQQQGLKLYGYLKYDITVYIQRNVQMERLFND